MKKTSQLFGFEGRWLKRGDGFELFYVMESTYRDALLEVYQGKGRSIVELYLGATKEIQNHILVSIDKANKGKKSRLGKKRVQEKTSSDSVLTNKISGQTLVEQDPVAKKPRLAIVSDSVQQVVSDGGEENPSLEHVQEMDCCAHEELAENPVSDEPALKRRRIVPIQRVEQKLRFVDFVGNLAVVILRAVKRKGYRGDDPRCQSLKELIPKNPIRTEKSQKMPNPYKSSDLHHAVFLEDLEKSLSNS